MNAPKGFIWLTRHGDKEPFLLQLPAIAVVFANEGGSLLSFYGGGQVRLSETPREIAAKIEEAQP